MRHLAKSDSKRKAVIKIKIGFILNVIIMGPYQRWMYNYTHNFSAGTSLVERKCE